MIKRHVELFFFLISLFFLNLFELISFSYVNEISNALPILLGYYMSLLYVVASFIILSTQLSGNKFFSNSIVQITIAILIILFMLTTDLFIAGVQSIGYSITRIKGEYYWVISVYLIGGIILAMVLLGIGGFQTMRSINQIKCRYIFYGFLPTFIVIIALVFLMHAGIKVNATLILPATTTFFIVILIWMENKYNVFRIWSVIEYLKYKVSIPLKILPGPNRQLPPGRELWSWSDFLDSKTRTKSDHLRDKFQRERHVFPPRVV